MADQEQKEAPRLQVDTLEELVKEKEVMMDVL